MMSALRKDLRILVFGLAALAIYYVLATDLCLNAQCADSAYRTANASGLSFLMVLCAYVIYRTVRRDVIVLLTPLVVFPLSILLFFSFGNMFFLFGETGFLARFSTHRYSVTPEQLLRANLLSSVGLFISALSFLLFSHLRLTWRSELEIFAKPRLSIPATASVLLLFGLGLIAAEMLLRLAYGPSARLPGILHILSETTVLGLALALYLGVKGQRGWYLLFWIIWIPYLGISFLEYSKRAMVVAVLLPAAGAYLAHGRMRRIVPFLMLAAFAFAGMQDLNTASRIELRAEVAEGQTLTLADRANILLDVWDRQRDRAAQDQEEVSQVWWQRLSYAGPQIRAMELYDTGRSTSWQVNPLVYFIPRAIWPNKPPMPALGRSFNWEVTGHEQMSTRVGITIYANGYWMMGWPGVCLFSAIFGAMMALVTRINLAVLANRNFIYLPAVFAGTSWSAMSHMGFFETAVLGGFSVYIWLVLVIRLGLILSKAFLNSVSVAPKLSRWPNACGLSTPLSELQRQA